MKNENNDTYALEILKGFKASNKNMFILAMVILTCWILTIGGFLWYLSLYDFVSDNTQSVDNITNSDIDVSNG